MNKPELTREITDEQARMLLTHARTVCRAARNAPDEWPGEFTNMAMHLIWMDQFLVGQGLLEQNTKVRFDVPVEQRQPEGSE